MADTTTYENQTPAEQQETAQSLSAEVWIQEIKASEKYLENFHTQAAKVDRRYLDKRGSGEEDKSKLNLFTTNTNILLATLYAKFPKPFVTREFDDQDDDVARVAANIIERMLKVRNRDPFDRSMRAVVQDRLVPGLGAVWFRYEPTTQPIPIPPVIDQATGQEIEPASEGLEITDEKVVCEYVHWKDIRWSPARVWEQLRWVGRMVPMSKKDAIARFGEVIGSQLSYHKSVEARGKRDSSANELSQHDSVMYTDIYEIWCKTTKTVYWISLDFPLILDKKADYLKLPNFFPTPKFLMGLTSTTDMIPRPDYVMVQDQYEELDNVNHRITMLERAIKVVGVYDSGSGSQEIERIFQEAVDLKIIPMRSFSEFKEKGGFKGSMDWLPLDMFTTALEKLRMVRQDLMGQIYEVTGISDIMRGSTRATETLGAQQLKAQYGSVRLQYLQMDVANFVEEALEMKAEIIRRHFQPQTIVRHSNIANSVDAQYVDAAIQLIKSPEFQLRVQVHADSMSVPEYNSEREDRMSYVRAIAELLTSAAPIIQQSPAAGVPLLRVLQWVGASFRTGSTIEGILDQAITAMQKDLSTPKPPPPPPALEVAKTKQAESTAILNLAKAHETGAKAVAALTEPSELPESPEDDQPQVH